MRPYRTRGSVIASQRSIQFGENKNDMRKLTIATLGLMLGAMAGGAFAGTATDDTTDTTKTKSTKSHKKKTTDTTAATDSGKMSADTTKTAAKATADSGKMAASDTKMSSDKMAGTTKKATTAPPAATVSASDIAAAKAAGKVWVNKSSKVYHMSSSKYYGATKSGAFMTEADAKAAGYHAA